MTTEAEIKAWIGGYVRDFDQQCQALMWQLAARFGKVVATPPSAIAAWNTEKAAGRTRAGTPPPGSFVYWDIGAYGHVGFMLNAGRIFMGTKNVDEQWSNKNTGPQSLDDYGAITGAKYLGWSYQNGGNSVPFTPDSSTAGGDASPFERKKNKMALFLFGKQPGGTAKIYVVAGLAGNPWVEIQQTPDAMAQLESQYGSALLCSDQTMVNFKNAFTDPDKVTITGGTGGGGLTAEQDALLREAAKHPSYAPVK